MLVATVKRIVDGDTIEVTSSFKVRFDFIDAPETKGIERPEGLKVKAWLADRLKVGDTVELDVKGFDMYSRALAVLYKEGANINGEMLLKGLAEVYTPANHDDGKMEVKR